MSSKIESVIVGSLFVNEAARQKALTCKSYWLFDKNLREIFEQFKISYEKDRVEFDQNIFFAELPEAQKKMLSGAIIKATEIKNLDRYIKAAREIAIKRSLKLFEPFRFKKIDIPTYLSALKSSISKFEEDQPKTAEAKNVYTDVLEEYYSLQKRGKELQTLFPSFDRITGGFRRGRLYILGGSAGSGKTSFSLFLAQLFAFRETKQVLFFSLEMSLFDMIGRLASMLYGVSNRKIQQPWLLDDKDLENLKNTVNKIYKSNLSILTDEYSINEIISEIKARKADIVFIDHLQYIPQQNRGQEKSYEILGKFIKQLRDLAKQENINICLLSQTRRKDRVKAKPTLHDFSGSSEIERQADLCMIIWRDYEDTAQEQTFWELHIVKNRNGVMGVIPMIFDVATLKYKERDSMETIKKIEVEKNEDKLAWQDL